LRARLSRRGQGALVTSHRPHLLASCDAVVAAARATAPPAARHAITT
jgi:hypothetical protein